MAYCFYDGNLIRPVTTVDITKNYSKNASGNFGKIFSITLNITLISYKGSPQSNGSFYTLSVDPPDENITEDAMFASLSRKEEAIRDLFTAEGKVLEFQPANGGLEVKCNPRVISINSVAGPKVNTLILTVTLEADKMEPDDSDTFEAFISDAQENWSLDSDESPENPNLPRMYRMSHTISAVGQRHYLANGDLEQEAWQQARDYVLPRLGLDTTILSSSGVNNLPSYYGGFNHLRSENIDENGGSFSVTETWIITSGSYLEDFTINTQLGQDGMRHVTVDGNVNGLEQRDSNMTLTGSKWDNAVTGFSTVESLAHTRAETYSSLSLNSLPLSKTIGRNPVAGTVSYSYEYNDRPTNFITDVTSEQISLQNSYKADLFAEIAVLGRAAGPVLQSLNTKQAATRSLDISLVFNPDYMPSGLTMAQRLNDYNPRLHSPQATEINNIITAAKPVGNALNNLDVSATDEYISNRTETWDAYSRSYNLSLQWTFE